MKKKELVHVGTFGQPQGLKGDIKINVFTSSFESFKILKFFFIDDQKSALVFKTLRKVGKKIIGSVMVFNFGSREDFDSYLAEDPYIINNVWDHEQLEIRECLIPDMFT